MSNSRKSLISVKRSAFSLYAVRCILYAAVAVFLFTRPAEAKYSGGTGEPNDPYQIATASDLIALGDSPEDYDRHFILTADIDLDPNLPGQKVFTKAVIAADTNDTAVWFQGTSFTGVFDGNGHTISHLTITGGAYLGLFGRLASGDEVRDLGVVDVNITGSGECVGDLVGYNSVNIATSYSTGSVSGTGQYGSVGGLVGQNYYGYVTGCFWDIDTSGQATSASGIGKTTAEMQTAGTFLEAGWDFMGEAANGTEDIWWILEGKDYPHL